MHKTFAFIAALLVIASAPLTALAVTGSSYPSLVEKNQFGETNINSVIGGSGMLDCQFIVAAADAAGKGITNLSGAPCAAVFMHTSQSAATGSPNPANGLIYVRLNSQYFKYLGGYAQFVSPLSGTPINVTAGVSAHNSYIISSLGNTSAAGWTNLGVPAGVTAAVGVAFIAAADTVSTGTGQIELPKSSGSGISLLDVIGDSNLAAQATAGAPLILRALAPTSSSVTTAVATAPADGTVIKLRFVMLPLSSQLH